MPAAQAASYKAGASLKQPTEKAAPIPPEPGVFYPASRPKVLPLFRTMAEITVEDLEEAVRQKMGAGYSMSVMQPLIEEFSSEDAWQRRSGVGKLVEDIPQGRRAEFVERLKAGFT
jgi:hypothetical protein